MNIHDSIATYFVLHHYVFGFMCFFSIATHNEHTQTERERERGREGETEKERQSERERERDPLRVWVDPPPPLGAAPHVYPPSPSLPRNPPPPPPGRESLLAG